MRQRSDQVPLRLLVNALCCSPIDYSRLLWRVIMKAIVRIGVAAFFILGIDPAPALELNTAIENCRNTVGKPIVMACMRGGGGSLESCRATATPKVRACVKNAMIASRPKAALFDAEKVSAPKPGEATGLTPAPGSKAASLVAPPRTVSDITSILDQQQPDPARIAELAATADASVPNGLKGRALGDFYYKRAQAKSLLGRAEGAVADAELAISNAHGSDYANVGSR